MRSKLPVMWRSDTRAWLPRQCFTELVHEVLYLKEKKLALRYLLIMDIAPAHSPDLENDLTDFINIKFLPPNTAPLLQPMDKQVITTFKKLDTKFLFQPYFKVASDTELTFRDFWRNHFNISHCISHIIDRAWDQVSYRAMNSVWR